jgi:hypothetical protein
LRWRNNEREEKLRKWHISVPFFGLVPLRLELDGIFGGAEEEKWEIIVKYSRFFDFRAHF